MHVLLATVGTDGDVFPHIGLGRALLARGHRHTLAGPETYRERAIATGLEFRPPSSRPRRWAGCSPTRTCGTRSGAGR
jgi:UDP:flavonoid glycosyltransferase YjiC (YdhE family)